MKDAVKILATWFWLCGVAFAQDGENGDEESNGRFWEARLKGGEYIVDVRRITSVSHHTFFGDGGVTVTEVVIDTTGASLVRFYAFGTVVDGTPAGEVVGGASDTISGLADEVGLESHPVNKNYPSTTHAKTVEYRLKSREELLRLYASAKRAWKSSRGRTFTSR